MNPAARLIIRDHYTTRYTSGFNAIADVQLRLGRPYRPVATVLEILMIRSFASVSTTIARSILLCFCGVVAANAQSVTGAPIPPPVAVPLNDAKVELVTPGSDDDNYISDRISFPVGIWVTRIDLSTRAENLDITCAPAGTQFRGIGVKKITFGDSAEPREITMFLVEKVGKSLRPIEHVKDIFVDVPSNIDRSTDNCRGSKSGIVSANQVVLLEHSRIDSLNPVRKGVTYGTLLVPYKYHRSGEKGFSGGTSLGGYLGYRLDRTGFTGFETNFISFVGATSVAVPEIVDGVARTSNRAGVSYGVGLLATVKDEFQIGLVIGRDRVDDSANYVRNGKSWLALSIGYEFSN